MVWKNIAKVPKLKVTRWLKCFSFFLSSSSSDGLVQNCITLFFNTNYLLFLGLWNLHLCLVLFFSFAIKYVSESYEPIYPFNRFTAPSVSVVITPTGTAVVGQLGYSFSCSVSGADSLSPTSTTYRWYNESTDPRSQVGTTSTYSFTRLQPYHAGRYACEVTVTSPYLSGALSQSMMQDITVQSMLCNLA